MTASVGCQGYWEVAVDARDELSALRAALICAPVERNASLSCVVQECDCGL